MKEEIRRVSVPKQHAIELLVARVAAIKAQHKREAEAYAAALPAYHEKVAKVLERAAAAARRGKLPKERYGNQVVVPLGKVVPPPRASRARELQAAERQLALLRASTTRAVLLDPDEYAQLQGKQQ